ncbi:MAG: ATP-binding protein [Deltaproteobacteria bacterium]|nr:ATP-binding protein [Deltaproteobacteria bacterium]
MKSDLVFKRVLNIHLPLRQSAFLWGARQTGKSTYLKSQFPKSLYFDLLESDVFLLFTKEPFRFREEILFKKSMALQHPIIVDEVQKVPLLLDEIHTLIENQNLRFILCGSSARKLKRGHANLLGGRAWRYEMFPLVFPEIPQFDLLKAMNRGLLPSIYPNDSYQKSLKAYVADYLTQEIKAEGLSRNLRAFSKFLDSIAYSNGELVVYNNIASDCGVDAKTVKEYYEILVDTHLGYFLNPLVKKQGRKTISATPKFYVFDMGIANYLAKTQILELRGAQAGKSFEHFIYTQLMAYRSYQEEDFDLHFWRTKTDLEVDFIINKDELYIESKITDHIKQNDLRGLLALMDEKKPSRAIIVCNEKKPRSVETKTGSRIEILPWILFMEELWSGELI